MANSRNLVDPDQITTDSLQSNGTVAPDPLYVTTGFIPVQAGVMVAASIIRRMAFYNPSKAFVSLQHNNSSSGQEIETFLPPANGFVRVSTGNDHASKLQVEYGTTQTAWVAYGPLPVPDPMTATVRGNRAFVKVGFEAFPLVDSRRNRAPTPHGGYGLQSVTSSGATVTTGQPPGQTQPQPGFKVTPDGTSTNSTLYPLGAVAGTMARMGWARGDTITVTGTIWQDVAQSGETSAFARSILIGFIRDGVTGYADAASETAPNGKRTGHRLSCTFTIPADADEVVVRLLNGSQIAAQPVWWNYLLVERASSDRGYFDGDQADTVDAEYSWEGAPGSSFSLLRFPDRAGVMTLYRQTLEGRQPVPGLAGVPKSADIIIDTGVPLNRPVTYLLDLGDGKTVTSNQIVVLSQLPLLTDPVSGDTAEVWVQSWAGRTHDTPAVIVQIPGRRDPIILADVEKSATSSPKLLTRTVEQERDVDTLLAPGGLLHLRTICPDVPDAYIAVTSRTVDRLSEQSRTGVRVHGLSVQEVAAESMRERARGQTLGDIAAALPGQTLGDLANIFPGGTLLDIAGTDWIGWDQ